MNRRAFLAVSATLLAALPAAADDFYADDQAWRQKRERSLRNPDGWLTLVGLFWLELGDNTLGAANDNRFVLPRGPAHAATVRVGPDGSVSLQAAPGAAITLDGKPVRSIVLDPRAAEGAQRFVLDSLSWYLINRGGRLALRVKDSRSAVLASFQGVPYFPPKAAWRVPARFEKAPPQTRREVPTAQGMVQEEDIAGFLTFELEGRACRLEAYAEDDGLFVVFGDLTNGHETYPAGRYLQAPRPDAQGRTVLDFNRAYNPPCAFTPFATCSYPTPQNKLPLRVEAGEKRTH